MLKSPVFLGYTYDWYWIIMIITLLICSIFFVYYNKKRNPFEFKTIELIIILYAVTITAVIGANIFSTLEVFFTSDYSFRQFDFISTFRNGVGDRWYGSLFIIVLLLLPTLVIYVRDKFFRLFDTVMITAALSLIIGKWGCFLSGHYGCYGTNTLLPWGCTFQFGSAPTEFPVHPVQVYDSLFHLLLIVFLFKLDKKKIYGLAGITFLICTSSYNIVVEFIRTNKEVVLGINFAQITYFIILFASLI